ncbi:MAG: hypothetical protein J7L53_10285 [Deltaproteobacteria bacterium]|nr:hypothetical protein [Deltaproteobacteria bacterium]
MRKIGMILQVILLLVLVTGGSAFADYAFTLKLGADVSGELKRSGAGQSSKKGVKNIGAFSWEMTNTTRYIDFGAGVTCPIKRSLKHDHDYKFCFTPFYGLFKVHLDSDTTPYLIGQIGYNSFDIDRTTGEQGGLYYGSGIGYTFMKGFLIEALYSVNKGKQKEYIGKYPLHLDVEYSKVTISVGKTF